MNRTTRQMLALVVVLSAVLIGALSPMARADEKADCEAAQAAFAKADAGARAGAAQILLDRKCPTLPAGLVAALRTGKWADGAALGPQDRLDLLRAATAGRHPEAETLSVALLEAGAWPDGKEITLPDGVQVIGGLGLALTPYRVRLLMDIYDQQKLPIVRVPIVLALGRAEFPGAKLPAVDASFAEESELRQAARQIFASDAERDAELARLARELPSGPMREWAVRLVTAHPSAPAKP